MSEFGKLELSNKGTNNGNGYDIYYEFSKGFNFIEIESKRRFYFIQPWVQFPNKEYSEECQKVSIELVKRFNDYESLQSQLKQKDEEIEKLKGLILYTDEVMASEQCGGEIQLKQWNEYINWLEKHKEIK